MGTNGPVLEDSGGGRRNNPSEGQIRATVERIGDALDHCILHLPAGAFVQVAGNQRGLFIEYGDGLELFAADKSDFDVEAVTRIFVDAMAGRGGWKNEFTFRKIGDAPAGGSGGAPQRDTGGGLKDQLLGSVKRELSREASRGIGSLVRKGVRGITRR